MSVFIVGASVVVKWFVPEIHSHAARRVLVLPHEYVAPDRLFAETANAIWKKICREELTAEEGQQLVSDVRQVAVETVFVPGPGAGRTCEVFRSCCSRRGIYAVVGQEMLWRDVHRTH